VRVNDVRLKPSRARERVACKLEIPLSSSCAPVEHGVLDVVPARQQLRLEIMDEGAEIRIVGARIEL
jgi:hypothetical protein